MALPKRQIAAHYRLLIIGDAGTGKTAFLKRHLTEEYEGKYEPTVGEVVHRLHIITHSGARVRFHCLDTAGKRKNNRLRKYLNFYPHCALIMIDVTDRSTYKNVPRWLHDIRRFWGRIPIVLCGNKVDIENKQVMLNRATFLRKTCKLMSVKYYEISVKSNCNLKKPFLNLVPRNIAHFGIQPFGGRSRLAQLLANGGIEGSQGEIAGSSRPHPVENGAQSMIEVDISKNEPSSESQLFGLAISEYLKQQKSVFEFVQVSHYSGNLKRYREDNLREYGYWYHVTFIAMPRNADCTDFFPKLFFAELRKLGADQYTVTACSMLVPSDPGVTYGCGFCRFVDHVPHPAEYVAPGWTYVRNTSMITSNLVE